MSSYLIKGSAVGYYDILAPVDGVAETNGTLVQNVASGVQTYQFTGFNPFHLLLLYGVSLQWHRRCC